MPPQVETRVGVVHQAGRLTVNYANPQLLPLITPVVPLLNFVSSNKRVEEGGRPQIKCPAIRKSHAHT